MINETPAARQLKILKDNEGSDCAIGWFKNPERETYANYMFTAPEEAATTIPNAGLQPSQFNLIKLAHMPMGEYRYILCSHQIVQWLPGETR